MIHSMIYRSHTDLKPSDDAYRHIIDPARARNFSLDITGFLHWEDGIIHQWIEGPAAELAIVEQVILSDRRHRNITVLDRRHALEREFEGWSMAASTSEDSSLFEFITRSAIASFAHAAHARNILSFMKHRLPQVA